MSGTSTLGRWGRWLLGIGGIVVALSLLSASTTSIGAFGVFLVIVGLSARMFRRPQGRPASSPARRISRYVVRPDVMVVPEAVLAATAIFAIWTLGDRPLPSAWSFLLTGLILGVGWALITMPPVVGHIAKDVLGFVGVFAASVPLLWGDECFERLPRVWVWTLAISIVGSLGAAVAYWVWRKATLRSAGVGAYLMALVGLLSLLQFTLAPAGENVIRGLPAWGWLVIVAGFGAALFLTVVNPEAAEALVGVVIAVGGGWLVLTGARLGPDDGLACHAYGRQVALILGFVVVPTALGGWRSDRGMLGR